MRKFFNPLILLLNRLEYSKKFTVIGIIILIPFAVTLYLLVSEVTVGKEFVEKGRIGLEYNRLLRRLIEDMPQHRGMTNALLKGDISFRENRLNKQNEIDEDIEAIDAIDEKYGASLKTTEKWNAIKAKWKELKGKVLSLNAPESFNIHTSLIADILSLIIHIGDHSNLISGPVLESTYLADLVISRLPLLTEYIGQARGFGAGVSAKRTITHDERTHLTMLYGVIKSNADISQRSIQAVFRETPYLRAQLESYAQETITATDIFLETLNQGLIKPANININPSDYFEEGTRAITAGFRLYDSVYAVLDSLLASRAEGFSEKKNLAWAVAVAAMLLMTYLFMAFFISVVPALKEITSAAEKVASGDLEVTVEVKSEDEIGILASAFNNMAINLKNSIKERKQLYEVEQRKVQEMAVLQEVISDISSDLALEPLLERLALHASSLLKAELAALAILNPETGGVQYFKANVSPEDFPVKRFPEGKGLLKVVLDGTPLHLENASSDLRFEGLPASHPFIGPLLGIPLMLRGKVLGGLFVANKKDGSFSEHDMDLLMILGLQSATAVENARLYTKTVELATTDDLTGVSNRRVFMEELKRETSRASRYNLNFSLLMIDIDHFKWINDSHGHPAGDFVLKSLARILRNQVRQDDFVARYGGEEFAIILPETSVDGAKIVGERIRRTTATTSFSINHEKKIGITLSIGISCFPECAQTIELLIERADQALYTAKRDGRNKVVLYRETLSAMLEHNPMHIAFLLNSDINNIQPILSAIDIKAPFFRDHTEKVEHYSSLLAKALNLNDTEKENLRFACLLHDIGIVTIQRAILEKPGAFTEEEWKIIREHSVTSAKIIENVINLKHIAPVVRSHHEWYDGKGYPDRLKGEKIPYLARIIAVADAYTAMVSEMPWYKTISKEEAKENIKTEAGSQFDPEIVEVFCRIV